MRDVESERALAEVLACESAVDHNCGWRGGRIGVEQRPAGSETQTHRCKVVRADETLDGLNLDLDIWIARRPHVEGGKAAGREKRQAIAVGGVRHTGHRP